MTTINRKCRFAPVAPVALLQEMIKWGEQVVGPYHLLLAHDVLANRDSFTSWARDLRASITKSFLQGYIDIIMDSSVIELGAPVSIDTILEAAEVADATTIVLPDIIGDQEATHDLVDAALQRKDVTRYKTMFVPQGKTLQEYIVSLETAALFNWGTCIGLPRDAHEYGVSRGTLALVSRMLMPDRPIHLLGFSNHNITEDFLVARTIEGVLGIDSAVPVRVGQQNQLFSIGCSDYGPRGTYWEHKQLTSKAKHNIQLVRTYLSA